MASRPRILLIDSYDSFTYNLASLCKRAIPGCGVHIIKNNSLSSPILIPLLNHFDAVVIGPGPGSPDIPEDIGVIQDIWSVPAAVAIPVFGVCLGLQSLGVAHGAKIRRLNVVKHGQVSLIRHLGTDIFQDLGDICAVRYHSLHIQLSGEPDLIPLAWADDGEENGEVIMALRHKTKPFWSVQYHPESVCTHGGGEDVVRNFWSLANEWSTAHSRKVLPWNLGVETLVGADWPSLRFDSASIADEPSILVETRTLQIVRPDIPRVCELLGVEDDSTNFVMLDSAAAPGRISIIGCLTPTSPRLSYLVGDSIVQVHRGPDVVSEELGSLDIWTWLAAFMRNRKAHGGSHEVPFWGGLMGYLSYELGVDTLTTLLPRKGSSERHPDVNLVFVQRSIVVDSDSDTVYVQSIVPNDTEWVNDTTRRLKILADPATDRSLQPPRKQVKLDLALPDPVVTLPDRDTYISKITAAKEWLFSGDSYELCVTAPTQIVAPKAANAIARGTSSSWDLYKTLRMRNPAPHSGYIRLHPSTLVSSSPERFLSYARPPGGMCQLRPIKGTVRKAPDITRAVAEERLSGSRKEVAENLMIVDLIRHDLHSVVGEDVQVKQFCKVEEYETVWQLVSVIEGRPDTTVRETSTDLGWEVLRASLPPGSMTGAPKKRSVEILRQLEGAERGIYSGVVGYADVGGGGDWAVIIRSCFKYDENPIAPKAPNGPEKHTRTSTGRGNRPRGGSIGKTGGPGAHHVNGKASHKSNTLTDVWTLGAGGAITALSDPVAEWEEMVTKVESVLRAFGDLNA